MIAPTKATLVWLESIGWAPLFRGIRFGNGSYSGGTQKPMELGSAEQKQLERLEEGLWKTETRFDMDWMERTLAPDFLEFGRSGRVYSRKDTLGIESQTITARLPLTNFRARLLSPDVALVTYISCLTYDGVEELGNRSSIWSRAEHGWQLRFHQGTPVPQR